MAAWTTVTRPVITRWATGHPRCVGVAAAPATAGLSELCSSFPDLRVAVGRTVAQGDLGVGHYRMSGTQLGEFMGSAASGRTFDLDAIDLVRMQGGRIVEHWGVIDEAVISRRLGIAA
jgi:predicted ester cyclase